MFYRVDLEQDDNGTIMASFPDVPGAITYGDTAEEALEHATDALLTVFDALMRDKKDLPTPAAKTSGVGITIPALEASKLIVYRTMRQKHLSKYALGKLLKVHAPQVDRMLDVRHASQFGQIEMALKAMGKRIQMTVVDLPPSLRLNVPRRSRVTTHAPIQVGTMVGARAVKTARKK